MKTIKVELNSEQIDDICHALLVYEIDSRAAGYEHMPKAIHDIRQYLLTHLDECFN